MVAAAGVRSSAAECREKVEPIAEIYEIFTTMKDRIEILMEKIWDEPVVQQQNQAWNYVFDDLQHLDRWFEQKVA